MCDFDDAVAIKIEMSLVSSRVWRVSKPPDSNKEFDAVNCRFYDMRFVRARQNSWEEKYHENGIPSLRLSPRKRMCVKLSSRPVGLNTGKNFGGLSVVRKGHAGSDGG